MDVIPVCIYTGSYIKVFSLFLYIFMSFPEKILKITSIKFDLYKLCDHFSFVQKVTIEQSLTVSLFVTLPYKCIGILDERDFNNLRLFFTGLLNVEVRVKKSV